MEERRKSERVKSLLKAKIYFNNRTRSYDCVVKNISLHGAKVAFDKNATVPNDFELEIPSRGKWHQAKVRWRDGEGAGVEFMEDADAQVDQSLSQLEQLQAENARLKGIIRVLTKRLEDLGQDVQRLTERP